MNNFSNEEFDCHFLDEGFTAKDILDQKINEVSSDDDKDAFYVVDLGDILKKHLRWLKVLPRVTPFFAVKCNDNKATVKTLASIGTGFDCASKTEIQLVQSLGVPPQRIIYANPCKQVSQIKYAANNGVEMMTFDSEVELTKVARAHPKAKAISDARCVFDMGAEVGFSMYLLDIDDGSPRTDDVKLTFGEITSVINPALDKNTGSDDEDESSEQTFMYYVNDRVYGSFNCVLYGHEHVKSLLQKSCKPDEKYYSSSIWGPTCDGLDRIVECCGLPEMHVGDWMLFENMGAYTVANASTFNGFQRPTIYYVMSGPAWQVMQQIEIGGFPPKVEEQDASALSFSCAWESGMKRHPATCAPASINV
ncbi:ornithine decarboxylase-like [Dasypus novemcinctus]|uniref:ornithine decarboxylase-like n=1 Tax=Dasypus novemcinctus TaxID=9361 RepID=UPI00265E1021|nr:ornithine decarboxylase-like [Dasypus novemcinctus]